MKKDLKIYIAGHKGMVGSALMRMLQKEGYVNIVTRSHSELDLTRQNDVEKFFKREKPEYVFLAAAKVGGILANDTYKGEFIYKNIMIAANIIHNAYKSGAVKLLNLGSSCIYPKLAPQPMREDVLLTGSLEPTNEPYAIAKISALKLCRYYNEQYGTDFISVMPTNLYGPHDNFNLETSHVLPALIRKFHLAKLLRNKEFIQLQKDIQAVPLGYDMNGKSVVMNEGSVRKALDRLGITEDYVITWGAGEVYREFLHVDDLAKACIFLMENYNYKVVGEMVNIGTGMDIKIQDLAFLIKEIIGFEGNIKNDLSKPDGTPKKLLDISRAKKLGWEAKIMLEEGIKRTYEWYCNQLVIE
jgi:GDP-L-fucose synthase